MPAAPPAGLLVPWRRVTLPPFNPPQHTHTHSATWCKVYSFPFQMEGSQVDMVFTSVAGHLMELEFLPAYTGWHSCSPQELFTAPVRKAVPKVRTRGDSTEAARAARPLESCRARRRADRGCSGAAARLVARLALVQLASPKSMCRESSRRSSATSRRRRVSASSWCSGWTATARARTSLSRWGVRAGESSGFARGLQRQGMSGTGCGGVCSPACPLAACQAFLDKAHLQPASPLPTG